jgi:hypothetical protein
VLPVFVTVTVIAALVVPTAVFGNASEVGVTVAVRVTGTTPVPLRLTGEPFTVALAVIVAVPE